MLRKICVFPVMICSALLLSACGSEPDGNIMDGDGMVYDFVVYNIQGDWVLADSSQSMTLHFNHDDMNWTDSEGISIPAEFEVLDGNDNQARTLKFRGEDIPCETMLYRRMRFGAWNVGVLFEAQSEEDDPVRIYVKKEDLRYLKGKIPSLKQDFIENVMCGNWTEYGSDQSWHMTVNEKKMTFVKADGSKEVHEYSAGYAYNYDDLIRSLNVYGPLKDFMSMEYREKIIAGSHVRMIFAFNELDGSERKEVVKVFVRDEDLPLIPEGYQPDFDRDNAYVYTPQPEEEKNLYEAEDVLDLLEWLGKKAEEAGVEKEMIDEIGSVKFTGRLFGKEVTGTAHSIGYIYDIAIYTEVFSSDELRTEFTALYGEPEEFDNPYVAGEGYTEGQRYRADPYLIEVRSYSNLPYLAIDFKLLNSPY